MNPVKICPDCGVVSNRTYRCAEFGKRKIFKGKFYRMLTMTNNEEHAMDTNKKLRKRGIDTVVIQSKGGITGVYIQEDN